MTLSAPGKKGWKEWFKPFARLGYGARGLVYLVIAFFVMSAALTAGSGGDAKSAIRFLTRSVASEILTPLLIVALAGYSMWRLVQAGFDTDDHGASPVGLGIRAGLVGSAVSYGFLMLYSWSLWRGQGGGDGGSGGFARFAASLLGATPVSLILASIFLIVGGAHIYKAAGRRYRDHISASQKAMAWIDVAAIGGLVARGLIFFVVAFLFYRSGLSSGGDGPASTGDALRFIAGLPFGTWLLGAMGAGLFLFSLYSFSEAVWRRINVEDA
ncbi:MAG: DUF1206 domain-containing protein [Hoeflea sp.]|uniref:DUF1206 domain-containing protein n=1 Tax=Hoeflea sp. TaxID=1940281 RepID=UPI0032EC8B6E